MSDSDDKAAEIRQQKREQLRAKLENGTLGDEESDDQPPDEPVHVTDSSHLQKLLDRHETVFVDFYADWCGPCQQLAPIVERLASDTDAAVAKVDVDAQQSLAGQYQVRSMPTMLLFSDGQPAERVVGARGYDQLAGLIRQYT